jgi:hypothetical protein
LNLGLLNPREVCEALKPLGVQGPRH